MKWQENIFSDGEYVHLYNPTITTIRPNTILQGYFQSYKYFEHIKNHIQTAFDMPISASAQQTLQQVTQDSCPVAIHYRDYSDPSQGNTHIADAFGILPTSYYNKAMEYIRHRHPNATFYVFSNRPQIAKNIFQGCHIANYNPENFWDDMMVMTHCHHLIMGNSSYSWWAGYLNRHKNPTIITEKQWGNLLKDKCTEDIFLPDWIKI